MHTNHRFWQDRLGLGGCGVAQAGYNQVLQELHMPRVLSHTLASIVLIHFPDWSSQTSAPGRKGKGAGGSAFQEQLELLVSSIQAFSRSGTSRLLAVIVCPWASEEREYVWGERRICEAAQGLGNVHVVVRGDVEGLVAGAQMFDPVADEVRSCMIVCIFCVVL